MSATSTSRTRRRSIREDAPPRRRARGSLRPRGGRRVLAPVAGMLLAAGLVAGCGAQEPADPEDTAAEETQEDVPTEDDTDEGQNDGGEDGGTDPGDGTGDAPEDGTGDAPEDGTGGPDDGEQDEDTEAPDDGTDGPGEDENLFEGSWHMGHHENVLPAEELAAVLEAEALDRGPDEMHLTVECEDGVDGPAGDDQAQCVAIGDEGARHPWAVTALGADAGLEIEVENIE